MSLWSLKNIHMLMKTNFHICSSEMVVVKGQVKVALEVLAEYLASCPGILLSLRNLN